MYHVIACHFPSLPISLKTVVDLFNIFDRSLNFFSSCTGIKSLDHIFVDEDVSHSLRQLKFQRCMSIHYDP